VYCWDKTGWRFSLAPENRRAKTQTLSLRLDPKTRFVLEFMARFRGQAITVVVERAIKQSAGEVIEAHYDSQGRKISEKNWEDFWDHEEGVRTLKLLAHSGFPSTYEEDEIRRFTLDHSVFFYVDRHGEAPHRANITVLWPRLDKYLEIWRQTKSKDYWAAGKAMAADLEAAQIAAPEWPAPKVDEVPF
jgi:uncharacterized protein (DUF1778 family)